MAAADVSSLVEFAAKVGKSVALACSGSQWLALPVRLNPWSLAMHFLLLLVRLLLERLVSGRSDKLTLAARADGRLEQLPNRRSHWMSWLETGQSGAETHRPKKVGAAGALGRPPETGPGGGNPGC